MDGNSEKPSSALFWKDKCTEVYSLCLEMKDENENASLRCRQLADMSVGLMSQVQDLQATADGMAPHEVSLQTVLGARQSSTGASLPRLVATQHLFQQDSLFALPARDLEARLAPNYHFSAALNSTNPMQETSKFAGNPLLNAPLDQVPRRGKSLLGTRNLADA